METFQMIISSLQQFYDPVSLIKIGGLALILVIIYLETGFFLGLVLPGGDYLVFTAGVLCGTHYLDIPFGIMITSMIIVAILGDFTGYMKGRWLGSRLFSKKDSRIFKRAHLEKTKSFYEKYGMGAFVIGRFLPFVRTLIPMLAGASKVSRNKFALFNITGAVAWIGTLTTTGYLLGKEYPQIIDYSIYLLLGFVLIASIPVIRMWLLAKKTS